MQDDIKFQFLFSVWVGHVNFLSPIFAFLEGKHTFLKRYIERRFTNEYSTVSTAEIQEITG